MITDEMVDAALRAACRAEPTGAGDGMGTVTRRAPTHASMRAALESADRAAWQPIETAPTDGTVVYVYASPYEGLPGFVAIAGYHPDAGWCVDELRDVTHWRLPPAPPAPEGRADD